MLLKSVPGGGRTEPSGEGILSCRMKSSQSTSGRLARRCFGLLMSLIGVSRPKCDRWITLTQVPQELCKKKSKCVYQESVMKHVWRMAFWLGSFQKRCGNIFSPCGTFLVLYNLTSNFWPVDLQQRQALIPRHLPASVLWPELINLEVNNLTLG